MQKKMLHKFKKTDKYKHVEVPFEVSENIDILEIDIVIKNDTDEECIIDIGVKDPERVRGWTGSNKRHLIITKEYATPGYFPGKIQKGTWGVLLSVYKIPEGGCEAEITVVLKEKQFRWIKGDTHLHTIHSDGDSSMYEIVKVCKELRYDYLISSDHNTLTQNPILPIDTEMLLIPGVELTTYHGHASFLGANEPFSDYRCSTKEDILSKFKEAKAKGAYIGINHPNACDNEGCVWEWGFDLPFDWIEIWNLSWSFMNEISLEWWQKELCKGSKIPVIGGSDNHKVLHLKTMPLPVTHVYVNSIERMAVLEGFKKGNVFISCINGPVVDMKTDNNALGETTSDKKVRIGISGLMRPDKIKIITDRGIEKEYNLNTDKRAELEFKRENQSFVRLEIRRYNKYTNGYDVALLTNPIYFEN